MHLVEKHLAERRPLLGALPLSLTKEEAPRASLRRARLSSLCIGSLWYMICPPLYSSAMVYYMRYDMILRHIIVCDIIKSVGPSVGPSVRPSVSLSLSLSLLAAREALQPPRLLDLLLLLPDDPLGPVQLPALNET